MKTTTGKCISALFIAAVLAGCQMIPLQNRSVTSAESNAPLSASAGWARIVEMDREAVRRGLLSPEVIPYDLQIAQMIPEGEEIRASRDKAKARIWTEKLNTLTAARSTAMGKMTAREMAENDATSNAWADRKPDPCLSPMGKNICAAPPAQQGGVNYSAGPGGIGATVGGIFVGPGGISGTNGQ
ncbi:hypothetical protein [Rhodanobacter sp. C01]|uniref:hypothetical protein n=1 Tax=Rhodanobacter sp. C01 TaxID=1945856 RepID=UPI000984E3BE|nr:hypothetical protein [Rhodanobacter sp. C01]OOG45852.1 hypothetical protein B0E50_16990 [Rhodanobacter sp. C01]